MPNGLKPYGIAAPICSVEEVEPLLNSGANEVYFGIMTDRWKEKYGDAEFITRRQSEHAHISSYGQFSSILEIVSDFDAKATLVLNANYTEAQMPYVLEIIAEWEERGGHAVMVSDLGILLHLKLHNSKLARYLSVMAGVFNHESVAFFRRLNVSRIVLPRELTLDEMSMLIRNTGGTMDFEVITMFQKCQYIDSFCNFIHVAKNDSFLRAGIKTEHETLPLCHGCVLPFHHNGNQIIPLYKNECSTPYCAACQLAGLLERGIRYFKIAGRGYPVELILKTVSFIKNSIDLPGGNDEAIKGAYQQTFGKNCKNIFCYYS